MKYPKAGELVIFLKEDNRVGILLERRVEHESPYWKVLMQTGAWDRKRRILESNLMNGHNSRYKFVAAGDKPLKSQG